MGHVRDLPKSKMGVDTDNNFEPTYEPIRGSGKTINKLKKLAKEAETLYLATDPDREGEAISWHLLQEWNDPKLEKKSKRAVFHEITKDAVLAALNSPQELNIHLVDAQQARRILDRLVGYTLSPVLWRKVRRGLSAGRVQSVALRLIVERELEIEKFKPDEYWEVDIALGAGSSGNLRARVFTLDGKKYEPTKAEHVDPIRSWVPNAAYTVEDIEQKERQRKALAPFTTSTVQQAAANRLGYTAKRTMQLAQELYEEGLITYHRTDSTNLSQQALAMAREYIGQTFGNDYLPRSANVYEKKSKNAQEAHEAIRPTSPSPELVLSGRLTSTHAKLYDLIFRRFIASQMTPAKSQLTTVTVGGVEGNNKLQARTTGSIVTHPGWTRLFPAGDDVILPAVKPGDTLKFQELFTDQKFTLPPPRFNDASLVRELEKRGIGRPSTFASIISVILTRGYVERQQKAFIPTPVGRTVIEFLLQNFPEVIDYDFTAHMEDDLDEISLGNKPWRTVMAEFYSPFAKKLTEVGETAPRVSVPVTPLNKPCPKCGLSEEEFPHAMERNETMSTMDPEKKADIRWREQPKGELVLRSGRFGQFISCSRYPECDYAAKWQEEIDMDCPQCHEGRVVVKKTKKGRIFYGCSLYPKCDFASWTKPEKE